ncbi:MAG: response regulator transcription factor [Acidaminococcaceae bacterium]|nr:response regulator transcription factor [Acidaminococcaceae bacterium]
MKKILIVEDDPAIAELERDYLEANNFAVDIAVDGMTGLTSAVNNPYDLILLDIMLPKMDGFQVCRELRKHKEIPILMVSAKREDVDKIRGLGLGADDYVIKPFSPSELVARVKAHINRYERLSGKTAKEELLVGALRIELQTHRVFVGNKEITLTNKEFELLVFLAENLGIVFNKETIFERVWGLEAAGDTATVMVHINRLREKIEPDPTKPVYIETVWGVGYRMKKT